MPDMTIEEAREAMEWAARGEVPVSLSQYQQQALATLLAYAKARDEEVERLRKALHKIGYEPIGEADASVNQIYDDIVDIARTALEAENARLKHDATERKRIITDLRDENARLEARVKRLEWLLSLAKPCVDMAASKVEQGNARVAAPILTAKAMIDAAIKETHPMTYPKAIVHTDAEAKESAKTLGSLRDKLDAAKADRDKAVEKGE